MALNPSNSSNSEQLALKGLTDFSAHMMSKTVANSFKPHVDPSEL